MSAQRSRLEKAGGDREAAIAGFLNDPKSANELAKGRAQYANDPAGWDAWVNKKINETTKGKFSGVLGGIAKVALKAAPVAAAFIPGLSPLAAAALAAGTKGVGDVASGQGFDPLGTLAAGAGVYGAKSLAGGAGAPGASAAGGGTADGGGFFHTLGGYAKDALSQLGGGNPVLGGASLVMGGLAAKESSDQRKAVEAAANYRNQLLGRGLGQAEEAYASRAPLREGGMAAIGKYLANPRGLFQTPGEAVQPPAPTPAPTPPAPTTGMAAFGNLRNAMQRKPY